MELKLSDCFENTDNEAPCLECTATMLNINYGHNQELMKHCRRLEEIFHIRPMYQGIYTIGTFCGRCIRKGN